MKSSLVATLRDLQSILCICPCCGELFRLSEAQVFHAARPKRTWFDRLVEKDESLDRAVNRFEEREEHLKEESRREAEHRVRRELRARDPILTPHGYYPKDAKCLLDPIDFVIFDGMHLKRRIRAVVLFDQMVDGSARERIQRSLQRAVEAGNYHWTVIKVCDDGKLERCK